ncbi:hypothetical protein [Veronia pacifica]|uniref:DUF4157 domain-containing protein n=1 Tax=Veronia pacifica TaxID=1080227 RepID=A0A1C3E706_9GAMM|nr:hypothetical protein [Veronia pacifica]ODA29037.1 hypothetical protein A8L45_22765 [Veronia pacifica]
MSDVSVQSKAASVTERNDHRDNVNDEQDNERETSENNKPNRSDNSFLAEEKFNAKAVMNIDRINKKQDELNEKDKSNKYKSEKDNEKPIKESDKTPKSNSMDSKKVGGSESKNIDLQESPVQKIQHKMSNESVLSSSENVASDIKKDDSLAVRKSAYSNVKSQSEAKLNQDISKLRARLTKTEESKRTDSAQDTSTQKPVVTSNTLDKTKFEITDIGNKFPDYNGALALYDDITNTAYIDGKSYDQMSDEARQSLLIHELAHAQQDQTLNDPGKTRRNTESDAQKIEANTLEAINKVEGTNLKPMAVGKDPESDDNLHPAWPAVFAAAGAALARAIPFIIRALGAGARAAAGGAARAASGAARAGSRLANGAVRAGSNTARSATNVARNAGNGARNALNAARNEANAVGRSLRDAAKRAGDKALEGVKKIKPEQALDIVNGVANTVATAYSLAKSGEFLKAAVQLDKGQIPKVFNEALDWANSQSSIGHLPLYRNEEDRKNGPTWGDDYRVGDLTPLTYVQQAFGSALTLSAGTVNSQSTTLASNSKGHAAAFGLNAQAGNLEVRRTQSIYPPRTAIINGKEESVIKIETKLHSVVDITPFLDISGVSAGNSKAGLLNQNKPRGEATGTLLGGPFMEFGTEAAYSFYAKHTLDENGNPKWEYIPETDVNGGVIKDSSGNPKIDPKSWQFNTKIAGTPGVLGILDASGTGSLDEYLSPDEANKVRKALKVGGGGIAFGLIGGSQNFAWDGDKGGAGAAKAVFGAQVGTKAGLGIAALVERFFSRKVPGLSGLLSTAAQAPSDFVSNLSTAAIYDTQVPATSKTTSSSGFLSVAGYAKGESPGSFGGFARNSKSPIGKGGVGSYFKHADGLGWFDVFSATNDKTGENIPLHQENKQLVFGNEKLQEQKSNPIEVSKSDQSQDIDSSVSDITFDDALNHALNRQNFWGTSSLTPAPFYYDGRQRQVLTEKGPDQEIFLASNKFGQQYRFKKVYPDSISNRFYFEDTKTGDKFGQNEGDVFSDSQVKPRKLKRRYYTEEDVNSIKNNFNKVKITTSQPSFSEKDIASENIYPQPIQFNGRRESIYIERVIGSDDTEKRYLAVRNDADRFRYSYQVDNMGNKYFIDEKN